MTGLGLEDLPGCVRNGIEGLEAGLVLYGLDLALGPQGFRGAQRAPRQVPAESKAFLPCSRQDKSRRLRNRG